MRLGEGTGAALGIGLVRAALACYREMATFKDAGVSERRPVTAASRRRSASRAEPRAARRGAPASRRVAR